MKMLRKMNERFDCFLGVPPRKASGSRFSLQVLAGFVPHPAAGFPLQSLTRLALVVIAIGSVTLASAQTVVAEIIPLHLIPKVTYRPLVLDSTLLFQSPNVVWRCSYLDGSTGFDWFNTDFARMKRCDCAEETYRLLPYGGNSGGYVYKLVTSEPRGSLVRTSDTTFTYTEYEFTDSTSVHRVLPMVFDTSNVVRTDTAYTEGYDGNMKMEVSKFVELKPQ
jgi:hypothetical protein